MRLTTAHLFSLDLVVGRGSLEYVHAENILLALGDMKGEAGDSALFRWKLEAPGDAPKTI